MLRAGLYARVSTNDQQTLAMQNRAMREYAARRGWTIALQVREVNSGAARREAREKLIDAARRREIDVVLVWRLDRWGRSVTFFTGTDPCGAGFWPDLFPREIGCAAFPKAHAAFTLLMSSLKLKTGVELERIELESALTWLKPQEHWAAVFQNDLSSSSYLLSDDHEKRHRLAG